MPGNALKVVLAQLNPLVGDIPGNTRLLIDTCRRAIAEYQADMVVFSELMLTAYPPEDLLLRPSLDIRIDKALAEIRAANLPCYIVFGYPGREEGKLFNMLAVMQQDRMLLSYKKRCLPNYQVFDEKRYFAAGDEASVLDIAGTRVAFSICEDMWQSAPMLDAAASGARLMININGSPFHKGKLAERREVLRQRVREGGMPVIYVNQVGGQDELVFDGGSMAMDSRGEMVLQGPEFEESLLPLTVDLQGERVELSAASAHSQQPMNLLQSVYAALVLGVRDYVHKNGFKGVVLGLSGGIDSALSLAVAVDALGAERVEAVMMPYTYTSAISVEDAAAEARTLGVNYRVLPIAGMYDSFMAALADEFADYEPDLTEQNLQARCRGVTLMAISNKKGLLVLTTSNKSEVAVGYSTLYGDMAGGFDVLKDVPKTMVYDLARYRNTDYYHNNAQYNTEAVQKEGQREGHREGQREVIPQRVIDRPPSAELAPGQMDEDNLPPYDVLDRILELYVEQDYSAHAIIEQGFAADTVNKVLRLVDLNEYKRRQAPLGVRISKRGFGNDRRYPVTSGWRLGE